jgi:hypothetical protein
MCFVSSSPADAPRITDIHSLSLGKCLLVRWVPCCGVRWLLARRPSDANDPFGIFWRCLKIAKRRICRLAPGSGFRDVLFDRGRVSFLEDRD